jgi:hypothetical protein
MYKSVEVNPEKTKCKLMSCCKKSGQKHIIKIANRSFEDVAEFKYLGITLLHLDVIACTKRLRAG